MEEQVPRCRGRVYGPVGDDEVSAESFELTPPRDELVKAPGRDVELGDHDYAQLSGVARPIGVPYSSTSTTM